MKKIIAISIFIIFFVGCTDTPIVRGQRNLGYHFYNGIQVPILSGWHAYESAASSLEWSSCKNVIAYELQQKKDTSEWKTIYYGLDFHYGTSGMRNCIFHVRAIYQADTSIWSNDMQYP